MNDTTERDRRRHEQLPLAFPYSSASGRDDLLVSARLSAAVAVIDQWPQWPAPVVILAGPVGSGKSHLAAIWRERSQATSIHPKAGSGAATIAAEGPVLFEDAERKDTR